MEGRMDIGRKRTRLFRYYLIFMPITVMAGQPEYFMKYSG